MFLLWALSISSGQLSCLSCKKPLYDGGIFFFFFFWNLASVDWATMRGGAMGSLTLSILNRQLVNGRSRLVMSACVGLLRQPHRSRPPWLFQVPVEFMETHPENLYCRNTCRQPLEPPAFVGLLWFIPVQCWLILQVFPKGNTKKVIDRL